MRLICVRPSARAEKRQKYKKDIKKRALRLFFYIGYFQYSVFCEGSVLSISRHTLSFAAHTAPTAGLCRHSCRESAERSRLFARASAARGKMRASWGKFAGACRCGREQVRVSKQAIKHGISFRNIGNSFIKKYKENKLIDHVCIIFVTGDRAMCKELADTAKKVDAITLTLNHIMDGLATDCSVCSFKTVCDEVEGLKELHFKKGAEPMNI